VRRARLFDLVDNKSDGGRSSTAFFSGKCKGLNRDAKLLTHPVSVLEHSLSLSLMFFCFVVIRAGADDNEHLSSLLLLLLLGVSLAMENHNIWRGACQPDCPTVQPTTGLPGDIKSSCLCQTFHCS
jgi:hypothetical protein